jgi:hypothetical protein
MADTLSMFELPRAFVQPALEASRGFNSALDTAFYDVGVLEQDLADRQATIDLDAGDNPEGAILVVDPARPPYVRRFEDFTEFLTAYETDAPATVTISGVGSSARGSAALAWDVAGALGEPVLAIVPGYGLADAWLQALGGWFGFGLHNTLQTKSRLQSMLALAAPGLAGVGRKLVGSVPETPRINDAPVFLTGSGASDVLHAMLLRLSFTRLVGHSKGALAIENALRQLPTAQTAGLEVVTLGCAIVEEVAGVAYRQYLGSFDWLGQLNSWGERPTEWLAADHSTNTELPFSLDARSLVRAATPAPPAS